MVVSGDFQGFSEVMLAAMDGAQDPPPAPPASQLWAVWLVQQMALTPEQASSVAQIHPLSSLRLSLLGPLDTPPIRVLPPTPPHPTQQQQEETLDALLADLSARLAHIDRHSAELARACRDPLTLIRRLTASALTHHFCHAAFIMAAASIVGADQLAVLFLSAWPHMPSFSGLQQAFHIVCKR